MKIITKPNKLLRERSVEISDITDKNVQKLIPQMIETMHQEQGIGLAAPQVGYNIRLIIVSSKNGPLACLNPLLVKSSFLKEWGEEGCLSVPGVYGLIKRSRRTVVTFKDKNGKNVLLKASGLLARVFQHEIDHLNGILFIDKAKNIKNTSSTNELI